MTANAGYHAYATGDVLTAAQVQYNLQNQTVMYFADTTARDAALTGAILVEGMVSYTPATGLMYYNGSAWTAVGGSGSTQTLLQNPVLNSAFQVWQRGTSFNTASAYTADRWQQYSNAAETVARYTTNDTTNLPNIQYCARVQRNSGSSSTSAIALDQSFETINSIPFVGKTVTFSYYARAGANFSSASNILNAQLISGTGTDQNLITGYTGQTNVISTTNTLTSTWQRFTASATVPTSSTQIGIRFYYVPTGTAGANDYFEVTGVQLDVGSTATPFRTFSTTIEGELAACQRYYYRATTGNAYGNISMGFTTASTNVQASFPFPVSMRVIPTAVDYATPSTLRATDQVSGYPFSSISLLGATTSTFGIAECVTSGMTSGRPYFIGGNGSSTAYIGFTAEL